VSEATVSCSTVPYERTIEIGIVEGVIVRLSQ